MASDDPQLLRDCLAGKPGAWEALVAGHGPAMRRAAARLGNDAEAEEACQRVFARLSAGGLAGFRGQSSLRTWLVAVALREAAMSLRSERRLQARLARLPIPQEEIPQPLQALCQREDEGRLRAALDGLPPRDRLILRLLYWDQASHAQAAGVLKVQVGSITTLLNHALSRLKNGLGR